MRILWKKTIIELMATVLFITIITNACTPVRSDSFSPSVTPAAITQVDPTVPPQPTEEETQQAISTEEISMLVSNFDDGEGFVDSYYTGGMLSGEFENLSTTEQEAIVVDNMRDQALAMLIYTKMGESEQAHKILLEMDRMIRENNMKVLLNKIGGERSLMWWFIAIEQFCMAYEDIDAILLLQYFSGEIFPQLSSVSERNRTTGQEGAWESEYTVELLMASLLKLKLIEAYGGRFTFGGGRADYDEQQDIQATINNSTELGYRLGSLVYDRSAGEIYSGYTEAEPFALTIQALCILEKDYPEIFTITGIEMYGLLEYIDNNFRTTIIENDKTYENLYRAANDSSFPVSFEATLQIATTYKMAADIFEMRGETELAERYRQKAQEIIDSVLAYTKDMGYASIPSSNENTLLFQNGQQGYRAPSLATLAQYFQFEIDSFFNPFEWIGPPLPESLRVPR